MSVPRMPVPHPDMFEPLPRVTVNLLWRLYRSLLWRLYRSLDGGFALPFGARPADA